MAALQLLPARQRAALILREVLGFSAREVADSLDTTVASVNSALQRARSTVDERLPEQSQQATLRSLGDERARAIVQDFMDAMEREDVDEVVAMLADDAAWSMPPLARWYGGLDSIRDFLGIGPLSGRWRWRYVATSANGQPAAAAYTWRPEEECFRPFALNVLAFEGDRISEITSFIARGPEGLAEEAFGR